MECLHYQLFYLFLPFLDYPPRIPSVFHCSYLLRWPAVNVKITPISVDNVNGYLLNEANVCKQLLNGQRGGVAECHRQG